MIEIIELRNKPVLRITLNENSLEVLDVTDPNNNGKYAFAEINNFELLPKKTDWLFSIFVSIVGLFLGSGIGGKHKNQAHFKLETINKTLKIWLVSADFEKAEKILKFVKKKTTFF